MRIVIDQMNTLLAGKISDSPFDSPSVRDKTPVFQKAFDALVKEQINPAFKKYRDFLQREYLPAAREAIAVSAIQWRSVLRRFSAVSQFVANSRC